MQETEETQVQSLGQEDPLEKGSFVIYQHLVSPLSVTFHFHCHLTFKCKTQMSFHVVNFYNFCVYLKRMCNMQLFSIPLCVCYIKLLIMLIKIFYIHTGFWNISSDVFFLILHNPFYKVIMCNCVIWVWYIVLQGIEDSFFCFSFKFLVQSNYFKLFWKLTVRSIRTIYDKDIILVMYCYHASTLHISVIA